MTTIIKSMIEDGYFTQDDVIRFNIVEAIFDYLHQRTTVNEPWNIILPISLSELEQDVWFTTPEVVRKDYDTLFVYLQHALGDTVIATPVTPLSGEWLSVGDMLGQALYAIKYPHEDGLVDDSYVSCHPVPEEYCAVMSQLLAKIVTGNVMTHGVLMLHFHSQFVRLGVIDAPRLISPTL